MSLLRRIKRLRFPYGMPRAAIDFDTWINQGIEGGWCGPAVCLPHDGLPMSLEEEAEGDAGWDPCLHVIRLYPDEHTRKGVEANHSPSTWRKP
jgi:hypothetical protein